ncbi:MAG: T9SS type A sorting domain-containing protein [Flavobacteriales bacterium]|nr:T9SS type A sorting domain-containing protein [Flavobacteriales bacterium]
MKTKILTILLASVPMILMAQQFRISPDVLAATGGEGNYQSYKVNWTLGETIIDGGSYSNGDRQVTNGFNQGFYCEWFGIDPNWCYVSVEELPTTAETCTVIIYPNLTAIELTVELAQWSDNTAILLHDMNGRLLHTQAAQGKRTSIDLSGISKGMYLISVTDGCGRPISNHRIIKQ